MCCKHTVHCTDGNSCDLCNYVLSNVKTLYRKRTVHSSDAITKPHQCTQCIYTCTKSVNLKFHMMTHTGEKPHSCTMCEFISAKASTLQKHKPKQTRPFDLIRRILRLFSLLKEVSGGLGNTWARYWSWLTILRWCLGQGVSYSDDFSLAALTKFCTSNNSSKKI